MDFNIPADLQAYLDELDRLHRRRDQADGGARRHIRFFDHRREWARTDFDNDGLPRPEWEALMPEAKDKADAAGHYRFSLPPSSGARTAPTCG